MHHHGSKSSAVCHEYALPLSYIHYALCVTKENQQTESFAWYRARIEKHILKLISLSQTFLHSLLHKPSSRPRHFKFPLANFHFAKIEDAGTRVATRAAVIVIASSMP